MALAEVIKHALDRKIISTFTFNLEIQKERYTDYRLMYTIMESS